VKSGRAEAMRAQAAQQQAATLVEMAERLARLEAILDLILGRLGPASAEPAAVEPAASNKPAKRGGAG